MSEINRILKELRDIHNGNAWHGLSLKDALAGLTVEQSAAYPIARAHNIWEIVQHIAGWENVWCLRLQGDANASEPEEGDFAPMPEISEPAWHASLARLNDTHDQLLEIAGELTDAQLGENLPGQRYSHRFLLRGAIRHHVYHTGQIAVLRKAFAHAQTNE